MPWVQIPPGASFSCRVTVRDVQVRTLLFHFAVPVIPLKLFTTVLLTVLFDFPFINKSAVNGVCNKGGLSRNKTSIEVARLLTWQQNEGEV